MPKGIKIFGFQVTKDKQKVVSKLPKSRVSVPNTGGSLQVLKDSLGFVTPDFAYEYIPVIRKLFQTNSSVSLAASSIVELANTGFDTILDASLSEDEKTKINLHLEEVSRHWGYGTGGIHGVINKMFYQIMIGGAVSAEWIPKNDLSGVQNVAFINPEQIRTKYSRAKKNYEFYQMPQSFVPSAVINYDGILLNPLTYYYVALMTDQESPIGIPPYLSSLDDVQAQLKMLRNIGFVSDQLGLMGFLEILSDKPTKKEGESDAAYAVRLEQFLTEVKTSIKGGLKDGIVAGYKDDHEFDFHNPTKDIGGAAEIFNINQRMVSNGLLFATQFLGGEGSGAETGVNIVFTKMLSQLHNVQTMVAFVLEQGFRLELLLAGFNVNSLKVKFKPSTITDQLKKAQAEEINIRNNHVKYYDGIIGLDQYAKNTGHTKADQKEPRDPTKSSGAISDQKKKEDDQKKDNKVDKDTRKKKKNQPKDKD